LLILILTFFLSLFSSPGYNPAFEADHVFKSNTEKYTFLAKKFKIPSLYYIRNIVCKWYLLWITIFIDHVFYIASTDMLISATAQFFD